MSDTRLEKSEEFFRVVRNRLDANDPTFLKDILKCAVSSNLVSIEAVEAHVIFELKESYCQGNYKEADNWLSVGQVVSEYAVELDVGSGSEHFLDTLLTIMS